MRYILLMCLAVGCVTVREPTREEAAVVVTGNMQDTAGCRLLGDVKGITFRFADGENIRTAAARVGANVVWVPGWDGNANQLREWRGQAYRCEGR